MTDRDDLQRGRLEQACGACGRWEAARRAPASADGCQPARGIQLPPGRREAAQVARSGARTPQRAIRADHWHQVPPQRPRRPPESHQHGRAGHHRKGAPT